MSRETHTPLRIAVIGAGWFASRRHLPDLRANPDVRIAALCRRSEGELRTLAEHFGVERIYTDHRALLDAEELDAVVVASPHALHFEHARDAIERGLHVLVEKPLAVTSDEAWQLVRRAKEKGVLLSTAVNPPFWSHTRYLRERVASGDVGAVEAVQLSIVGGVE